MEIQYHKTFPQGLQTEWDGLLSQSTADVPFLRYGCLDSWWQTRGGGEWPSAELVLLTGHDAGKLMGIAPFFAAKNRSGQNALLLLGSIEVFDYLDLIARPEQLPDFVESVLDFVGSIKQPACRVLDLYNIIEDSPTLPLLEQSAFRRGWTFKLETLQASPYITLPGDWETYLAGISKKQRHEVRRKMRRLEEAPVSTRWYIVEDEATLDAEMDEFLELMLHDPEKVQFLTPAMKEHMHRIARCAFQAGFLQLSFLEVDGKKAAGKMVFQYNQRLWAYNAGVNSNFREHSPGWVLLSYLLRWANEHGIAEFDFMRGNEEYKYRFGAVDRYVKRVVLESN